ncbi:hypothetical protein [Undibacterium sp.]|uniref:hypothetical protein n=1 Tax=Undibacterium sp. TaxID=1914977 RepID=UPI00272F181D|nr:hypothetical protein [Undibacterium sp.]MDP1979385.1 hypothetical protein [Undibacterium sp.]
MQKNCPDEYQIAADSKIFFESALYEITQDTQIIKLDWVVEWARFVFAINNNYANCWTATSVSGCRTVVTVVKLQQSGSKMISL